MEQKSRDKGQTYSLSKVVSQESGAGIPETFFGIPIDKRSPNINSNSKISENNVDEKSEQATTRNQGSGKRCTRKVPSKKQFKACDIGEKFKEGNFYHFSNINLF